MADTKRVLDRMTDAGHHEQEFKNKLQLLFRDLALSCER